MIDPMRSRHVRFVLSAVPLLFLLACSGSDHSTKPSGPGGAHYMYNQGTITFATNQTNIWNPTHVVDLDLATDGVTTRFQGMDAQRMHNGETTYLAYLGGSYGGSSLSFGVKVANAQGVPGPSLYVTEGYGFSGDQNCHTPRLSADGTRVAFSIIGGGGQYCHDIYGLYWGYFVVVRSRATGAELARFEGYYHPEWLPNGTLLMMGGECEEAGIHAGLWATDSNLGAPVRVDAGQITTPASFPTVNPVNPNLVAFVWNGQVWQMTLDAAHTLTQLTGLDVPAYAATWSPDGSTLAVLQWNTTLPSKTILFFKPGQQASVELRPLATYPYAPLSWN